MQIKANFQLPSALNNTGQTSVLPVSVKLGALLSATVPLVRGIPPPNGSIILTSRDFTLRIGDIFNFGDPMGTFEFIGIAPYDDVERKYSTTALTMKLLFRSIFDPDFTMYINVVTDDCGDVQNLSNISEYLRRHAARTPSSSSTKSPI